MLSLFKPAKGIDPEVYLTAIVSILVRYPIAVVRQVCDPASGLPSQLEFMPTPYDVKQACDALMRPIRERLARQQRIERQLAEREVDKSGPRQTLDQIAAEMAERGLPLRLNRMADQGAAVDWTLRRQLEARHGDAYALIPDRPGVGPPPDEKRTSGLPIAGKGQ